jgi:DNA-directed RNA polymerase subunit M/transcription elongation factor TFIIS
MTRIQSGRSAQANLRPCDSCGGVTTLVRVTAITNADHDSRVYACTRCNALWTALVELT